MEETPSMLLPPPHRYAAGALFALALRHSQIHRPQAPTTAENAASDSDGTELWIHQTSDLLWPVFRFLGVDEEAWNGLKEIACSSSKFRHHIGAFLKLLAEECDAASTEILNKEAALNKAVDAMTLSMDATESPSEECGGGHEQKSEDYLCNTNMNSSAAVVELHGQTKENESSALLSLQKQASVELEKVALEQPPEEATLISYKKKVSVLYALISACVADTTEVDKKSRQGYDARHRVSLRLLATWLGVKWNEMEAMESMVAFSLMNSLSEAGAKEGESVGSESNWDKWKRGGIIGAAAVTGGTLMAVTGGLAAPAIAHGLGALAPTFGSIVPAIGAGGFAAAATATGSVAGSVAVAASFGAAGAGLTGSKMATRIGSLEEFELKEVGGIHQGHLGVSISVSGLAFEEKDFVKPWEGYHDNSERYVLQYESKNLIVLSTAIQDWLTSRIAMELMKEGAMMTVLSSLLAALAWPATLITTFDLIDSKWAVAIDRSDKAGKVLAEVLLKGLQGNRPVTLVGFSLGARVIFKCLQFLADSNGNNAGLVEKVVFLGAPISIGDENWKAARKMVAGRFVNAYSTNDWTLGITFRASLLAQGLAGIQPVDLPGVENVDVTQLIEGHSSYLWKTQKILEQLELDNCFATFRSEQEKPHEEKSIVN